MKKLVLALATTAVLGSGAPAAADNPWSPAQPLPTVGQPNEDQFPSNGGGVVDADGTQTAVWIAARGVYVAERTPGGSFGQATSLDSGEDAVVGSLAVASTPGGDAIAVWTHVDIPSGFERTQYSLRPAGGSFGAPRTLHTGGATLGGHLDVAVNARGDAVVAWVREDAGRLGHSGLHVLAAFRPAGGEFGEAQELGMHGLFPDAAVAPDGSAEVAWLYYVRKGRTAIRAAFRAAGGSAFEPAVTFDRRGALAQPFVAAGGGGEFTTVWYRRKGRSHRLRYSVRKTDGSQLSSRVTLGFAPTRRYALAGGPDGDIALVWLDTRHRPTLKVRHRPAGHGFRRARVLAKAPRSLRLIAVEDVDGRLTALWAGTGGLYTATQTPTGGTIGPTRLDTQVFYGATATPGTGGRVFATWIRDFKLPPYWSVRG